MGIYEVFFKENILMVNGYISMFSGFLENPNITNYDSWGDILFAKFQSCEI
jgi:hypothetical protein